MCSADQLELDVGSEVFLENISREFSFKEELGKLVSDKLSKIVTALVLNNMEGERFKTMNKKYRRPENYPNIVAPKLISEICNEKVQALHRMIDINLRKIKLSNLSSAYAEWKIITSDREILDIIKNGLKINFKERPEITSAPYIPHNEPEIKIIKTEYKKILVKGVVIEYERDKCAFISTIFTRQMKYGSFRIIQNLKHLNHYVYYKHFK